jgi:hypothetical protein
MKKLRLYLDSSVLGWSLNRGNPTRFAEANMLLAQIAAGRFFGAYSWISEEEIGAAPPTVAKRLWDKIMAAKLQRVPLHLRRQAQTLAQTYCAKGVVPSSVENDAFHIAIATLWKADALVSYNFEHIVNLEVMVAVNEINRSLDLNEIFLCQPQEVITSEG